MQMLVTRPRPLKSEREMDNRPAISTQIATWALCTLDDALSYLKRPDDKDTEVVAGFVNSVSAAMETYCRRKLKTRTYDGAGQNEVPLLVHGFGTKDVLVQQYPVTAMTEAAYRSTDGTTWTPLNIANWYEVPNGIIELPIDRFPRGRSNIRMKLTAGYTPAAHGRQLQTLKSIAQRWIQVAWQDRDLGIGRGTGFSIGGQSVSLIVDGVPKDIATLLDPFVRVV